MFLIVFISIGLMLIVMGIVVYVMNDNDVNDAKLNASLLVFNGLTIIIMTSVILFYLISEIRNVVKNNKIDTSKYKIIKLIK